MTIEEKIFNRRRFVSERLLKYGFEESPSGFEIEKDFLNGDFCALINVSHDGVVKGKVIDKMNEEEYLPLRVEDRAGSFVGKVRDAYDKLLLEIAENCCDKVLFTSKQANRVADSILKKFDVLPEFPWKKKFYKNYGTFRHSNNRKWFALIMDVAWDVLLNNKCMESVDVINLKVQPDVGEKLMAEEGIYPGYHMNHKHWISVVLNDTLEDDRIMELIKNSFELTK